MIAPTAVLLTVCLALAVDAASQSVSTTTFSASIPPLARLSLSTNSVTFPDADPDLVPFVPAAGGPITITAKTLAQRNELVTLTVEAADDLRSGLDVLPASLITWTASGPGFVNGSLSRTSAQLLGSWLGSGVRIGTQTYRFENRWTHPSGIYTVTLTYTLTAP